MRGRRILIVEDDADTRDLLADALARSGAEVDVAANGAEALARLRDGSVPAVVLLDLRMPRLGGEELLRALRADPRYEHLPVITMTAGSHAPDVDAVAHLHKPFDVEDLRQIILSLVEADAA